jgi:hypothetical protein
MAKSVTFHRLPRHSAGCQWIDEHFGSARSRDLFDRAANVEANITPLPVES